MTRPAESKTVPGQGASVWQLQIPLRPLQGLARRLFVDTENNRFGGRIDVKADHIGGFRHERGVVALAPRIAGSKVNIVLAQEAPDILNINVAQGLGQQRTTLVTINPLSCLLSATIVGCISTAANMPLGGVSFGGIHGKCCYFSPLVKHSRGAVVQGVAVAPLVFASAGKLDRTLSARR
jgi:hypothetical protein